MTVVRTSIQYLAPTSPTDVVSGFGTVPVGTIVGWVGGYFSGVNNAGYNRSLGATDDVAGANAYLMPMGWRVCDGGEPSDAVSPIWNLSGKKVPQLNDRRFLQGSSFISLAAGNSADPIDALNAVGTIQGSLNTMPDHTHGLGSAVASAVNISHTHDFGTLATVGESSHTHAATGLTTTGAGAHSHAWPPRQSSTEGAWSIDAANSVATSGGYGDGSQNTYSDGILGINAWGSGGYATIGTAGSGTHDSFGHAYTRLATGLYYAVGAGGPVGIQEAGSHAHSYYLPSHRHWIKTRATTDNPSDHAHPVAGATAGGSSHTHTMSGAVAASTGTGQTQHTHTITGTIGSGNAPTVTENRPQYLRCFMIIRIK